MTSIRSFTTRKIESLQKYDIVTKDHTFKLEVEHGKEKVVAKEKASSCENEEVAQETKEPVWCKDEKILR